ncbi:MAG TPA: glycosyltransferase [Acidimicrobiales bacterium]|nr:glycosyltransferase [Acidimicrobiales bacterium]
MLRESPGHLRRIVLVTNGLVRAGTETQIVRLAAHLRAHGDEVGILSILPTQAFAEELAALGVPVAHIRLRPRMRALSSLVGGWRILRAWRPDALISFGYQANMLGRVAGTLARVPVRISSLRNENFRGRGRGLINRATSFLATTTTTNSELTAKGFVRRHVVPARRLVVIPNSIDRATIEAAAGERQRARRELAVAGDDFLWLAMGRLHPQKDYPSLLAAFAAMARVHPSARLRIAGEGPLLTELTELVDDLGLGDKARLLGLREDVPRLLAAADALVLASAYEGLPNVIMEAMAARLPVVATEVGGVPELVEEGRTGFLVPPREPEALARAMAAVVALPPQEREAMGERGREAVAARFSPERIGARWLELLDACPARASGRPRAPLTPA